jgi:hypothetical protein
MDVIDRFSENVNRDMEDKKERAVNALKQLPLSVNPHVTIWRKIMNSKITKIAAAVIIITTACLIIYQFGNSVNLTTVTFAQVRQAMNEVSWLHMTFTGDGRDEHDISEIWAGFETGMYASKMLDDYARYVDINKEKEYNYDPEAKTITINTVTKDTFEYDLGSSWALLQSMIGNLADEGANVQYSMGEQNGLHVGIITLICPNDDGCCTSKLFIDPKTHLILSGKQTWQDIHDNQLIHTLIEVEYPEKGPTNIYELSVPQTTDVIDHSGK